MKNIVLSLCIVSFIAPLLLHAQSPSTKPVDQAVTTQKPVDKATTVTAKAKLENPLKGVNSITDLFYKIVNFVISLSYVVIAAFLIWSGFKFVAAQGSDDKIADAKRTFFYTIIGGLIIVGAQTIIAVIKSVIDGLGQ